MRGAELSEVFERKVGARQLGVSVGFGYGSASNAVLMLKAARIHTRADSGLLKGDVLSESVDPGDDWTELLDGDGGLRNELLHEH